MLIFRHSPIRLGGTDKSGDDPRFANLRFDAYSADIGIIGLPFDSGVENGGGRPGASDAPDAIREQLLRYGTATSIVHGTDLRSLVFADCGNVFDQSGFGEHLYKNVTTLARLLLGDIKTLIVLGGGHDLSYSTVKSLRNNNRIGGMNIDAHFDVRPVVNDIVTSGTPFRRLLDEGVLLGEDFFEVGGQSNVNATAHLEYLWSRGVEVYMLDHVRKLGTDTVFERFVSNMEKCDSLFVSLDIDSVAQAFAPGSSAPSPDGFFPADVLRFAYLAGKEPRVRLFEIMEMNPVYDVDGRTARLVANIVIEFCHGFAMRTGRPTK